MNQHSRRGMGILPMLFTPNSGDKRLNVTSLQKPRLQLDLHGQDAHATVWRLPLHPYSMAATGDA